jgi:hypothetical protein
VTRAGLALTLCAPCAATAFGDDASADIGGSLKTYLFQRAVSPGDLTRAGIRGQISARGATNPTLSYYAAINFESETTSRTGAMSNDADFHVRPVELYAQYTGASIDVRVGRQFVFWGRTTWINPTDVLTGWDDPRIASEAEDYRLAPHAIRLMLHFAEELTLDSVWIPIFSPSRTGTEPPSRVGNVPVTEQTAARLSKTVSPHALDWALGVYRGFEKRPSHYVAPRLDDPGAPFTPTAYTWTDYHPRLTMTGGDFAKALGAFVLRGEFAVKRREHETNGEVRHDTRAESVIGANYDASDDLNIGVQYITRRWLDRDPVDPDAATDFNERTYAHQWSLWLNYRNDTGHGA